MGSALTQLAPNPPSMAKELTAPCQPSKQTPPAKRGSVPSVTCVDPFTGLFSAASLYTAVPEKSQGEPHVGISLGDGGPGGPPLLGLKSLPNLSSI